jgi:radical SAM superfamily enzyme YgiQ (UPF0313 family)
LQVLYSLMNDRPDWYCERAFTPWPDMEQLLREAGLPLYSLESYTPLADFDVLGFSLQYEICCTNILTMLDLGGIPLRGEARTMQHPLVIAGGPCAQNPEPLAPFIDVFVTGDGELSLPQVCDVWKELQEACRSLGGLAAGVAGQQQRAEALAQLAAALPFAYVPRFYEPEYRDGRFAALNRTRPDVPETIQPCVLADLGSIPLATKPIVPFVECVHDRIAVPGSAGFAKARSSSIRCGSARSRRLSTVRWRRTGTRASTKSRCCRYPAATIRILKSWSEN